MNLEEIKSLLDELGEVKNGLDLDSLNRVINAANALPHEHEEIKFFEELLTISESKNLTPAAKKIRVLILNLWMKKSTNPIILLFSRCYSLGKEIGAHDTEYRSLILAARTTRTASKKRKLLGWKTKLKVKKAAEGLRHKSKEAAAVEIAEKIGLSPGRVRHLLSEIFPGNEWHASRDT